MFEHYLTTWRDRIDALLIAPYAMPATEDVKNYVLRPVKDFIACGGKRLRPLLALLACEVCGKDPAQALPVAAALEQFQTAALIHDDIADRSEMRRNKRTLYAELGEGLALNCGDLALIESFSVLSEARDLASELKIRIINEFAEMMRRTVYGQALDIGWARDGRWDLTQDDVLELIGHKTAYYTAAYPLLLGAMVAGASEGQREALFQYGYYVGVLFQLCDDLSNLEESAGNTGKDEQSDITEGKRTVCVVYALEHASDTQKARLIETLSAHTTDKHALDEALSVMRATGALSAVHELTHTYAQKALNELSRMSLPNSDALAILKALPGYIMKETTNIQQVKKDDVPKNND